MKLISFDIGIKNMAYCILSHSSSIPPVSIVDWKVLNLLEQDTQPIVLCTCILAKSLKITKKQKAQNVVVEPVNCGKLAKFQKGGIFYCEKHAKLNTNYYIPKKIWSPVSLKKLKNEELLKMCEEHKIPQNSTAKLLKKTILEKMDAFFQDKCYEPIKVVVAKTSLETDLITIGRNMKTEMDKITHLEGISHVIMENQISPIATRMKTIQGMLAQYFIMKYDRQVHIEFVSSVNKLRFLEKTEKQDKQEKSNNTLINRLDANSANVVIMTDTPSNDTLSNDTPSNDTQVKSTYKEHKLDGVYYTGRILEQNEELKSWKDSLNTKKKDDLADCFLQGVWYMNHKELIRVDETYNIHNK